MTTDFQYSCPECLSPAISTDEVLSCSVCDWNENSSPERTEELGELEECEWEELDDLPLDE